MILCLFVGLCIIVCITGCMAYNRFKEERLDRKASHEPMYKIRVNENAASGHDADDESMDNINIYIPDSKEIPKCLSIHNENEEKYDNAHISDGTDNDNDNDMQYNVDNNIEPKQDEFENNHDENKVDHNGDIDMDINGTSNKQTTNNENDNEQDEDEEPDNYRSGTVIIHRDRNKFVRSSQIVDNMNNYNNILPSEDEIDIDGDVAFESIVNTALGVTSTDIHKMDSLDEDNYKLEVILANMKSVDTDGSHGTDVRTPLTVHCHSRDVIGNGSNMGSNSGGIMHGYGFSKDSMFAYKESHDESNEDDDDEESQDIV